MTRALIALLWISMSTVAVAEPAARLAAVARKLPRGRLTLRRCPDTLPAVPLLFGEASFLRDPRGPTQLLRTWARSEALDELSDKLRTRMDAARREERLAVIEAAELIAVFTGTLAPPDTMDLLMTGKFNPGRFKGWLVVMRVADGKPLCQAPMEGGSSERVRVEYQARTPEDLVGAQAKAAAESVEADFVREYRAGATRALAAMAPTLRLDLRSNP